jgi:metallo-beta-lactamase family protein
MKIKFWGGVGEVTGSNHLLEDQNTKILIDCGMFQGTDQAFEKNSADFSYDPREIEGVLITHAHIDHIGRLPKLVKDGFDKTIYSTAPTKDMAYQLLLDSYAVMTKNFENKNMVIYNEADIAKTMSLWKVVSYHHKFSINNFEIEYIDAGHILGSASLYISSGDKNIIFSGDLGNVPSPMIKDTEYFTKLADYALLESTYGARIHESAPNRKQLLRDYILDAVRKKSVLLIPAFAMERTQELLYEINEMAEKKEIPKVPIFVDSSLSIRLTKIYDQYSTDPNFFDQEAIGLIKKGDDIFNFPGLKYTPTVEESKAINDFPAPKVIIASSGMGEGGRVIHHEVRYLPDPNATILFVGFQAYGSKGRQVLDGAEKIQILGQEVLINAQVKMIGGYSAHADQPLLMKWAKETNHNLKKIFITHGDLDQAQILAKKVSDELGIETIIPGFGQTIEL